MVITIIIAMMMVLVVNPTIITVHHGEIDVTEDVNCTIISNGLTVNASYGLVPGLWFGFIEYDCNGIRGSLISKFECKECGLFCIYNEVVPGCSQTIFLTVIGFIVGTIVMIPVMILIMTKWRFVVNMIVSYVSLIKQKRKVKTTVRRVTKYNKMTGTVDFSPIPIDSKFMNHKHVSELDEYKNKMESKARTKGVSFKKINSIDEEDPRDVIFPLTSSNQDFIKELAEKIKEGGANRSNDAANPNAPAYIDISENIACTNYRMDVDAKQKSRSERPSVPPRANTPPKTPRTMRKLIALTALAASGMLPQAHTCDKNIYINSAGKICENSNCYDSLMASFPLMTGQLICYKDVNGSMFDIKITNAYYRNRYQLLYYTSDFEIKHDTYRRCLGTSECGPHKSCFLGAIGEQFKTNEYKVEGYDCRDSDYSCDNFCFRQASCSWIKWWLVPKGEIYPVYRKISSIWEVVITVSYQGLRKVIKINVNNPTIDITEFKALGLKKIPIYVNGFTSELISNYNGIVIVDSKAYSTDVSDLNMPQTGMIGDYQTSIDRSNDIYDSTNVHCTSIQCITKCIATEPRMSRFVRKITTNKLEDEQYSLINGDRTLETKVNVNALINVMVGNLDIANLYSQPAHCDLDVVTTYACIGCTTRPYIVLKSRSIIHEGTLKFESNCSFSKSYVSCNPEMYTMTLNDGNTACYIYIPSINKTIDVNFNYIFTGKLDMIRHAKQEDSTLTSLKEIVSSDDFMKGILSTILSYSIISVGIASILRVYKIYMVNKMAKKPVEASNTA